MRRRVLWLVGAIALSLVFLAIANVSADVQIVVRPNVVYADRQHLDAYLPVDREVPTPAVLVVHGGGWKTGSRTSWAARTSDLARRLGWATFAVDYDLTRPDAQVEQVRAAVGWVRDHAGELGVDPDRIELLGSSAGGHLSMLVATTGTHVTSVVSLSGPTDLPRLEQTARPDISRLAKRFVGTRDATALSPVANVSADDPPMLLANSDHEAEVPLQQLTEMHDALQRAGVHVETIVVPGTRHASRYLDDVWDRVVAFLRATARQDSASV